MCVCMVLIIPEITMLKVYENKDRLSVCVSGHLEKCLQIALEEPGIPGPLMFVIGIVILFRSINYNEFMTCNAGCLMCVGLTFIISFEGMFFPNFFLHPA